MAELMTLIGGQPIGIAFGLVCLYFLNRNYTESVKEKVELIQIIRQERLEWLEASREERRELMRAVVANTEASSKVASEMHALRGRLTEWMLRLEKRWGPDGGED